MRVRRINGAIDVDDSSWFVSLTGDKNCALKFQRLDQTVNSVDNWWTPQTGTLSVYNTALTQFLGQVSLQTYSNTDPISSITGALSSRYDNLNAFFTSGQFIDFDWITL